MVSTVGLILDIAGVVLIYRFGLPIRANASGGTFIAWGGKDAEGEREYRLARILSPLGLLLLIIGFALQAISNWL